MVIAREPPLLGTPDKKAPRDTVRAMWNEWTRINAAKPSVYYDIDGFLAGDLALDPLERALVGPVAGKRLLHSQCHFGLTTLSWARLGADVTGVDFSDEAIALADRLKLRAGLTARFVCGDVLRLPEVLPTQDSFDIVFTSYGVLTWLDDLGTWARHLAHTLKPGGRFVLLEEHPLANMYEDSPDGEDILQTRPYFSPGDPMAFEIQGSYSDPLAATVEKTGYAWAHSLAAIVTALMEAGLILEVLEEYDHCAWPKFRAMRQDGPSTWRLRRDGPRLPLMFGLRARKAGPLERPPS